MMTEEEQFERYYVPVYAHDDGPAGPDLVKEMATAIDFTVGGSVQLLSGYRGAGKTTELMRLRRDLDRDAYVPVYIPQHGASPRRRFSSYRARGRFCRQLRGGCCPTAEARRADEDLP